LNWKNRFIFNPHLKKSNTYEKSFNHHHKGIKFNGLAKLLIGKFQATPNSYREIVNPANFFSENYPYIFKELN